METAKPNINGEMDPLYFDPRNEVAKYDELEEYFESGEKDVKMLNHFPNVKKLFLRTNTSLSSSVPVKRYM